MSCSVSDDIRKLNDMAETATNEFLVRNSITYLECAISLMLTHVSKERVAEILRQEARMVLEFD